MNVAVLVKEFPPDVIGGTETQTLRMARELDRRGHEVTVYTKAYPGPEPHDPPFRLVRVPNWRRTPVTSTLTFALAALLYLVWNADRHDVLQCMMIYPNGFIGLLVERVTGLPYFAWIRGGDYYFMKDTPGKRWTIRRTLADTLVLVQTPRIEADVRSEFPEATLRVLANGVDVPDERADGDALVFVGRLVEQKGVDVLLRAADGLDERLLIVGDGPERESLEALSDRLAVEATFVGEVPPDRVTRYLRDGKLLVLPSVRGEGLPNAVLEAMALGLPVVATDTGGVADAIREGETGRVVAPGDGRALRDAIRELCRHEDERDRMARNAREYVERNHGWGRIVDELTEVYERCVERRR